MYDLIIGAPFGNYIRCPGVTSTIGTFTWQNRAGILKRIWRIISTVRYYSRLQSWINQLGLPNPSIRSASDAIGKILSIHGFNSQEWIDLCQFARILQPEYLELNLSCPNVTKTAIKEAIQAAEDTKILFGDNIIAKLAPIRWMDFVNPLMKVGINKFHLCNTIATPGGGFSGKILKQYSIWAVDEVKQKYGKDAIVIGGGGITSIKDIDDYLDVGANHVSVASMLFNPFRWKLLPIFRDYLNGRKNELGYGNELLD